ncbi:hypothetical protein LTR91_006098 [Friedmanniomyces endolithicus]|uniref:FAM50A/XAP5 C-terminal domain-containing protein n=1 Tax=Friedmanniomyces endolithicus TaxID=329885 RepID=A0AAN6KST4_9PEZI|nr:hypothetical protein LTR35_009869 [Friedmanniomyces endolithicus]KAK0283199.1 hypothetical protein LTS00_011803 [Friedmanniomyces endolithicus]KAK0923819.1 hypothetical protein LTR57_006479 [Friedmanniomyces endolithicus]KAK0995625.1 hypothetical protein LTR54_010441 [Friedmanniomyces endolithicus]KAK0999301.1 hypothetical protein LTR91_006098 [Friedmanniomyces endolithicus]
MADPASGSPSGSSTPNARFASQAHSIEDLLKEQTYGLVHLSDFRKRRAEARELSERTGQDGTPIHSGTATPDGREPATKPALKKRKKVVKTGGLSFGGDEDEQHDDTGARAIRGTAPRPEIPAQDNPSLPPDSEAAANAATPVKKRLRPNTSLAFQPKAQTKAALLRDHELKDQLRKQYTHLQEAVKQTDFMLPFTFFDGKGSPGGSCRMKKGDPIWMFLERARKVGADMAGRGDRSKKDWARIGVDDLMLVRGDLIVPHHYDFHYFLVNRAVGYNQQPIFAYSAEPTAATPPHLLLPPSQDSSKATTPQPETTAPASTHLSTASTRQQIAAALPAALPDISLEGYLADPSLTKVVDRRWYERNKHIYPASLWEDFDPARDYSKGVRKDGEGNALFYSRR